MMPAGRHARKRPSQGDGGAPGAADEAIDPTEKSMLAHLAQFGQWLVEHQSKLVQELYRQSQEAQAALLQKIEGGLTAGTAGAPAGGALPCLPQFQLTCLALDDDIEAYFMTFEQTAALAHWLPSQWMYNLGPYLSGPAQTVWWTMPANEMGVYEKLKEALLDRYGVTEDYFHLKFCSIRYAQGGGWPCAIFAELRETDIQWLKPTTDERQAIIEKVILDHVYQVMPTESGCYGIRRYGLTSLAILFKDYLDTEYSKPSREHSPKVQPPDPPRREVWLGEGQAQPSPRGQFFGQPMPGE